MAEIERAAQNDAAKTRGTKSGGTADWELALQERFGFAQFRPGQREVIERLMSGRSTAAVFPTGGGKSLCYQLPATLLPGLTLVISPLIALMKDQIDALRARGIEAARLDSSLTAEETRSCYQRLRSGHLKLLYVAPERFANERFRETVLKLPIALFAVDEAHCISEWGHNFRPDYLKLAQFAQLCKAQRRFALTATATEGVLEDICRAFEIQPCDVVRTGFYRPNLTVLLTPIDSQRRDAELVQRIRQRPPGASVIYVTLQRTTVDVERMLAEHGIEARAYHAGMSAEDRSDVQDWFLQGANRTIVATIAFGMGIDKSNIRYVYHYNLPKSLENYAQEIGRAGRDGEESICELLACGSDRYTLENFIVGDTPDLRSVRAMLEELFAQTGELGISVYHWSRRFDMRDLVVRTLLTYLELQEWIEGGTPQYTTYKLKPRLPLPQILERFDAQRRDFLRQVFGCLRRAVTWQTLDLPQAVQRTGGDRARVIRSLDYLAQQQWVELEASGVELTYRVLRKVPDTAELAGELHGRLVERERRDLERLEQVLELVELDGCQVAQLCGYFGEPLSQACDHCSWCHRGGKAEPLIQPLPVVCDDRLLADAQRLTEEFPEVLSDASSKARLLCGIRSPQLTAARLTRHRLFGSLEHAPFRLVLERLQQH